MSAQPAQRSAEALAVEEQIDRLLIENNDLTYENTGLRLEAERHEAVEANLDRVRNILRDMLDGLALRNVATVGSTPEEEALREVLDLLC